MPRLPTLKSTQEERKFWETHDSMDYIADFDEVKDVRFVRPAKAVMTVRIEKAVVETLKRLAKEKGVRYTSLVRLWLIERLARESGSVNKKRGPKEAA